HYRPWSGGVRCAFHWASHQLHRRSSISPAAVRRWTNQMDNSGFPIGDSWTGNRLGIDPINRICRRTRMETVEECLVQAPETNCPGAAIEFKKRAAVN